jgi:carbonic anhydrase
VIRSLAISQRKPCTRVVMLIHHSGCGMQGLSDDAFRAALLADSGQAPDFAAMGFADVAQDVRASLRRVRCGPFLPHRDAVRGFVLDLASHRLAEVVVS